MPGNSIKNLSLSLLILLLSSCTSVEIPNIKICAVAGVIAAGADCAYTLSDKTEELTLNQFMEFLEPQSATEDTPARGPALCQSTEDFTKIKTALQQACKKLGSACSMEMKKNLKKLSIKVTKLTTPKVVHPIRMDKK